MCRDVGVGFEGYILNSFEIYSMHKHTIDDNMVSSHVCLTYMCIV